MLSKKLTEWRMAGAIFLVFFGFLFGLPAVDLIVSNQVDSNHILICGLTALLGPCAYLYGIIYLWKTLRWLAVIFLVATAGFAFCYVNISDRWGWPNTSQRELQLKELVRRQSRETKTKGTS